MRNCILCRCLAWLVERESPGWIQDVEDRIQALSYRGLNTDALFEQDADPARLRQVYELWSSDPSRAFSEFLLLAKGGSLWSMVQVGGPSRWGSEHPSISIKRSNGTDRPTRPGRTQPSFGSATLPTSEAIPLRRKPSLQRASSED